MTRLLIPLALLSLTACKGGGDGGDKAGGGGDGGDDSGGGGPDVPEICNDPVDWGGGDAYADETEAWGLVGISGSRMTAADLDGDGYPDLVVSEGNAFGMDDFSDPEATRYHWVMMNRDDGNGGRTFVDETQATGLFQTREAGNEDRGRNGMVNVYGDVDNDGDLDVFSGQFYDASNDDGDLGERSEVLLNDGSGNFSLAETSSFWKAGGYATTGASFNDFDADGRLDLFVVGWYERYGSLYGEQDHLYRGQGDGGFEEVTEDAGLEMLRGQTNAHWMDGEARRPGFGATSCDLNGDALPDLLVSNYGRAWNQQWMNQGDGRFEDVSMESGFAADDNLDYSDNQFYRCYCAVNGCDPDPGSALLGDCATYANYWNAGWDDLPHRLGGNTFSTACADVDNDGDMDVISSEIVHWHIGGSSDPTELLLNDGTGNFERPGNENNGLFRDWSQANWNEGDLFVSLMDFDNDGWKDVLLVTTDYDYDRMFLFRQVAEGQFEEVGEDAGMDQEWPAGLAVADFDRDGDLDVVTGQSTTRSGSPWEDHQLHFYENGLGGGNWLRVQLEGTDANRAGIGARVEITTDGLSQVQEVSGGYGHVGMHHDTVLHFGLDDACTIEEVTVTWPGGAVDIYEGVHANYEVVLTQGGDVVHKGVGDEE